MSLLGRLWAALGLGLLGVEWLNAMNELSRTILAFWRISSVYSISLCWVFSGVLFTDCPSPAEERLGLSVLALGFVKRRHVVEGRGYVEMLWTHDFLHDRQRPLEQRLSLGVPPPDIVDQPQVV